MKISMPFCYLLYLVQIKFGFTKKAIAKFRARFKNGAACVKFMCVSWSSYDKDENNEHDGESRRKHTRMYSKVIVWATWARVKDKNKELNARQ